MTINPVVALVRLHELEFGLGETANLSPERIQTEIERCRAEIGPALLARYEQLKKRFGSSALAEVQDNVCSGCRISLPQTLRSKLRQGITFCEHCARILYDPEEVYNLQY